MLSEEYFLQVLDLEAFMINASDAEYDFVDDMKEIGVNREGYSDSQKEKIDNLHQRYVRSRGLA